jgi:hypothetical protein
MSWGWGWYPKPKPRRPANGIKAQSKKFGQTWWASKWLAALERLVDPARLGRGRSYARSGQVLNIDITPGRVESRVQGSWPKPYNVEIEIKALSNKEWDKVADAMASQAIFAAKLLSGEMPQDIEEVSSRQASTCSRLRAATSKQNVPAPTGRIRASILRRSITCWASNLTPIRF